MARARNIKPGFFDDDRLAALPPLARLLWISLWTIADREGRLEDRPARIKAKCLPFDRCDAAALLVKLDEAGFIKRYTVDGQRFICIPNFRKHQNPHVKEPKSTIPPPDEPSAKPVPAETKPEPTGRIPDSGFPLIDSGFPPATSAPTQPAALHAIPGRKPDGNKLPKGKVNGESKPGGGWWSTAEAMDAIGREWGIPPRPGEIRDEYKQRLFAEQERRKRVSA
jgi:hypothetical protein